MAGTKEIRLKIKSVQNTRKITKAMEMVAASKMKKAQERMRRGRPYAQRLLDITMHAARANTEYKHPLLTRRATVQRVGVVVVTTDKGLCGGLNTNLLRLVLNQHKEWLTKGIEAEYCTIGNKGLGFINRMGGKIVSQVTNYGDHPALDRLIGPVKMLIDGFLEGRLDEVHIFSTRFVNTMKQEPTHGTMIPIPQEWVLPTGQVMKAEVGEGNWDYLYEPDAEGGARPAARALPRDRRLPGGHRQHRLRAVGAHGGDEGRFGQRAQHHRRAAARLQQEPAGLDHEGTLRDRGRRGGRLATIY